jgi:hypothetical protein
MGWDITTKFTYQTDIIYLFFFHKKEKKKKRDKSWVFWVVENFVASELAY